MKKSMKLISILMVALMIMMAGAPVFAAKTTLDYDSVSEQLEATEPTNMTNVRTLAGRVLGALQWIAIIGGILVITFLGIKYMMGSLEEKSQYKKSMIPLIVGIIVVMSATTIANVLFKNLAV